MNFEEYWENYGELHASFCNGDIKQFAKEIWASAEGNTVDTYKREVLNLRGFIENLERKIEQLEKEKDHLYDRCLENEEAMYDAVIKGNDNRLIELVEEKTK